MLPLLNLFLSVRVLAVSIPYCAHLCMKCNLGISNFLEEISRLSPFKKFCLLFFCIVHLRLSYLSLLFSGTLNWVGLIFPFLLCLLLLFFSQLLVRHCQNTTLPSCISFSWSEVKSLSCVRLCDPKDCSLPGSSVHGIFQVVVLEWIAISFSRGSSQPRDRTRVFRIVDRRFTIWATRGVHHLPYNCYESPSIVLRALCLSHLIPWIYSSLPLYKGKGFDLGHTWKV